MNDVETVKKCLDTILKKGDLYDAIAKRENVKLQKHTFIRNHILLFSRILYGGIRVYERAKSLFSPIEEVKKAQDKIREILGVNVDFVKTKHQFELYSDLSSSEGKPFSTVKLKYEQSNNPTLSILYENSYLRIEEYVEHLKKILYFCDLYSIQEVFLRETDIIDSFPELELDEYRHIPMKKLLDCSSFQTPTEENDREDEKRRNTYEIDEIYSSELLQLNKKELRKLIHQLNTIKVSKQVIISLGRKIEDRAVRHAIADFFMKGNLEKLKSIVSSRLALLINSDSSYKDKNDGKVFQNVTIKEEYINVISMNKKGEIISNTVTTLYDYLGALDYKSLLRQLKIKDDNHEILAMTALQLYLCQSIKIKGSNKKSTSFYDYVYYHYKAKRKGKVTKIPGLYTKGDKRYKGFLHLFSNTLITILLLIMMFITGASINFIEQIAFNKNSDDMFRNILEIVATPYLNSWNFEKELVGKFINFTEEVRIDFSNFLKAFNGDVDEGVIQSDRVIANVKELVSGYDASYFATGYADSAFYDKGRMEYSITMPTVDLKNLQDLRPVLEVNIPISGYILETYISENKLNIPMLFYPLGNNERLLDYELVAIMIYDDANPENIFTMDSYRYSLTGETITGMEMEFLKSMSVPRMSYQYGIGNDMNSFIENLNKSGSYTENSPEDIRNAIIKGLGLEKTASDDDIFLAIASKYYSYTPIKDAGLSRKIKKLDEVEYFETVASMDSLVCNLAATLAVGANEELVYTIGYSSDDEYIRENEAHAWAMHKDGMLVEVTPSTSIEEKETDTFIEKLLVWGIENKIPIYALIAYIGYEVDKVLGRKIRFRMKVQKISKELTNPETEESYAKLREALYGGINIPATRSSLDLLEALERDFGGFTSKELKEIKEELLKRGFNQDGELDLSLGLMNKAPFIKENSDEVKKILKKKMI